MGMNKNQTEGSKHYHF